MNNILFITIISNCVCFFHGIILYKYKMLKY
nr:MAG TPA: hypothetical protein [Caudoviricetes sp.]